MKTRAETGPRRAVGGGHSDSSRRSPSHRTERDGMRPSCPRQLAMKLVVVGALTLARALGGCGGSGGLKPDGGTQVQLDATVVMDAVGPQTDATDAKVFDPGFRIGPPQATVVTAQVF